MQGNHAGIIVIARGTGFRQRLGWTLTGSVCIKVNAQFTRLNLQL